MNAIYNLLDKFRLESYYKGFCDIGVKDERDFIDSVTEEDLEQIGLTQVERNRFANLKDHVSRLRARPDPGHGPGFFKKMEEFSLLYTYPQCPEARYIQDMDPAQNTVEDLMLRICHVENVGNSKGVCLYTSDGMPLTDDPFLNTCSLKDRHIKNKDILYAIFTPTQNLLSNIVITNRAVGDTPGENTVRCHIMLRGNFEISVNLTTDTINDLKRKLSFESGVPGHALHYQGNHGVGEILEDCGISEDRSSTVNFSLYTIKIVYNHQLFSNDVEPSVPQTTKGRSVFLASLYSVKSEKCGGNFLKVVAYIRKLTGCNPLAQSLFQLICKNEIVTKTQKIAILEGLYVLFRELLPRPGQRTEEKPIDDINVFEFSTHCWAYLIAASENESEVHENYAPIKLTSQEGLRFCEPVNVPGTPVVFERAHVLQKIRDGERIPNCSEVDLQESSLKRNFDLEKILLSLPPSFKTYFFWISHADKPGENFQVNMKKTFAHMTEKVSKFPFLRVTPPLQLKEAGQSGPLPVLLSEDNLGICLYKDKMQPQVIHVWDFLIGKEHRLNLEELAARTGNLSYDHSLITCRTPKEAILVLMDTSSSMEEECYGELKIRKIDAVKELFDSFATRTMAYDFHHVIGFMRFSSGVKLIHTFTETLEKFKQYLRDLEPNGRTVLYAALQRGVKEMEEVKKRFPDCRLRIICLTDGNDVGSTVKPEIVAVNLIKSNIIVDSILLGKVDNNTLHGISNATGGCCFKPQTSTDGLKLFESETVLSLEMRKPKKKLDPLSITSGTVLRSIFAKHGFDVLPETSLPSEFNSTVTASENALTKKIQESKKRPLMEKDKRILEELRSLHCDPHPYFSIFPSESDFTFWKILMQGPPDTPYENGTFELYCQFGPDYPVKPPTLRFVTVMYHCNINNSGRICHNIFDRGYNAHIPMKKILDAIYGLLIAPEAEDPLDSILAEQFQSSKEEYDQNAKDHTTKTAAKSFNDKEQELVGLVPVPRCIPLHLKCQLTGKIFVDPVKTKYATVYERKALEKHLKTKMFDPQMGEDHPLKASDLKPDRDMKKMVKKFRLHQLE
ncbi:unnamed protein product [Gadus morhua 'NCC']